MTDVSPTWPTPEEIRLHLISLGVPDINDERADWTPADVLSAYRAGFEFLAAAHVNALRPVKRVHRCGAVITGADELELLAQALVHECPAEDDDDAEAGEYDSAPRPYATPWWDRPELINWRLDARHGGMVHQVCYEGVGGLSRLVDAVRAAFEHKCPRDKTSAPADPPNVAEWLNGTGRG
jgi:hypothetical protein